MLANSEQQEYLLDYSVIVPVFNHWQLIPLLLDLLKNQTIPDSRFEIILVDNGSDHIPEIDDLPGNTRIIGCSTPGSYAARNEGIKHAKGRILAFTDADCRPAPCWL
jgi:glycosyltransferase involved in cell wall biosynthesis